MRRVIKISAPGKLMLFGEHSVMFGKPCIVTAVDQRMTLVAIPTEERKLKIEAPDIGIIGHQRELDSLRVVANGPKGVRFVETAVKVFNEKFGLPFGVDVETKSAFETSGLGSSSASTVCTVKALAELTGNRLSKRELFDISYKTVLEVQGTGSGFDLAAAIWGGTLYYLYGGEKIEPIKIDKLPLVITHSGIKAETPAMVSSVKQKHKENRKVMDGIFKLMEEITDSAKQGLERKDYKEVGELANINQGLLEALGVGCAELSRLIFAARNSGAYGAKLSGAGGGDCMYAIVANRNKGRVKDAIKDKGGRVIEVRANAEGVRVEK